MLPRARIGPFAARLTFTERGDVPIALFHKESRSNVWRDEEEVAAFLAACELFLRRHCPDAAWTYGDDPVSREVVKLLKRLDIPIVIALDDLAHRNPALFELADYVVVPSQAARQHYWQAFGLASHVLPAVTLPADRAGQPDGFVAAIYRDFFRQVAHQPGAPLVPKEASR